MCLSIILWRYIWGVEIKMHIILTLASDEGGWSASCKATLLPGKVSRLSAK